MTETVTQVNKIKYDIATVNTDDLHYKKIYELLNSVEYNSVLEIGCGDGSFLEKLKLEGKRVYGIEIGRTSLQLAKRKGLDIKYHDVSKGIPYKDASFDVVLAGEVIEHIYDTDHFLKECHRVLRKEGYVILTTPNLASLTNRIRLLFGMYPRYMDYRSPGIGHVRIYTADKLKGQMMEIGFNVKRIRSSHLPCILGLPIIVPICSALGDMIPTFGSQIIIMGKKR